MPGELFVVGVSWRTTSIALRERLAFRDDEVAAALAELLGSPSIEEALILSTCNRVEIYGALPPTAPTSALAAATSEARRFLARSRGFHSYLPESHAHGLNWMLLGVSAAVALAGIGLAYLVYVRNPGAEARFAAAAPRVYKLSQNRFYLDELYSGLVVIPAVVIAKVSSFFDMLVDGIANDRNRGSYFGAHSFSTIGNFVGPTMGGLMLGAFGGAGMFLLFAGFAILSAVLFAVGTRMPPPKASVALAPAGASEGAAGPHLRGVYA